MKLDELLRRFDDTMFQRSVREWIEDAHVAMEATLARLRNTDTDHAKELRRLTK